MNWQVRQVRLYKPILRPQWLLHEKLASVLPQGAIFAVRVDSLDVRRYAAVLRYSRAVSGEAEGERANQGHEYDPAGLF